MGNLNLLSVKSFRVSFFLQLFLLTFIGVIISSPIGAIGSNLGYDYHFFEPIVGFSIALTLTFYSISTYQYTNQFSTERWKKLIHILSIGVMMIFALFDSFSNGKVLMSEISVVFFICLPIEIYFIVDSWKGYFTNKLKLSRIGLSINTFLILYGVSLMISLFMVYPHSFIPYGVLFGICLSIPVFFFLLTVREFIV
jgi:hypothetical protein